MPMAAPIIASAVLSGFAATAFTAFSFATFAGSLILGALSYALTPKPKKPSVDLGGSTVAVRQPDLTRQFVYGHTRVTRGYAHMESTGANGTLHVILMLCEGGEGGLRAINEIWVNDYCIPNDWIDENGEVTEGRYAGYMTIRKHLGTASQLADSEAVNNMAEWTNNHRLQGIAYLYIQMEKNQDVYPTGLPNISAVVEGPVLYDPRISATRWTTNIPVMGYDFLKNTRYGFEAADDDVDDVNTSAQANIADEIVTTTDDDSDIAEVVPGTDLITLEGDVLRYQFGDRVELVTAGTPPGGLATSTDYYVIPYQILTTPRIQLATSLDNAMAKVAIDITSTGSGSMIIRKTGEPRYHGGGLFDTESVLSETMNNLSSSMAGRATCIGGYWTLLAGAWRTPSLQLGISDMRGNGMGFKNDLSMAESFNEVKGLFISSLNLFQSSDYPSAVYQEFIDQDNGKLASKEINLPFTNRPTTAQRIAKIELFRGRQGIAVTSDFSMKALQSQPGDNIELTMDAIGWTDKEFEVTEFSFDVADGNLMTKLALRETAQEIFDWTNGEAITYDPAPNTNLTNIYNVQVPGGVKYNSRTVDTAAADSLAIVQLEWTLHPDAFVREWGDFEIQFKLSADTEWLPSFFVDGSLVFTDVFTASFGTLYDVRIRARNNLGVRSNWVTLTGVIVGSSGGVVDTLDWGSVADAPSFTLDWGAVADAPSSFEDWGYVL